MESFVNKLKIALTEPLPGASVQFRLAPESRPNVYTSENKIDAGVLLLLYPDEKKEMNLVFMKRPSYDGYHSGQISFPGGKFEETDNSFEHTALRETYEEIGVIPDSIKVLGHLSNLYIPVSNFLVYPFVGYVNCKPIFKLDKHEVEYVIEANIQTLTLKKIETTTLYHNNKGFKVPYFNIQNEIVWGATAMILNEFVEVLKTTGTGN